MGHQLPAAAPQLPPAAAGALESPAFDLHHPEIAAIELDVNPREKDGQPADVPEADGRAEHIAEQQAKKEAGDPDSHSYNHEDGDAR